MSRMNWSRVRTDRLTRLRGQAIAFESVSATIDRGFHGKNPPSRAKIKRKRKAKKTLQDAKQKEAMLERRRREVEALIRRMEKTPAKKVKKLSPIERRNKALREGCTKRQRSYEARLAEVRAKRTADPNYQSESERQTQQRMRNVVIDTKKPPKSMSLTGKDLIKRK